LLAAPNALPKKKVIFFVIYLKHRNHVIKREEMLKELWGENDYFLGRSLDVFITKIRKYLKEDPELSIENVFGVGFIFNVPVK
jgi:DNA-binding response OmpR family regulator